MYNTKFCVKSKPLLYTLLHISCELYPSFVHEVWLTSKKNIGYMLNKYLMYDRDYYQANREHINQQHRENYAKHRDEYNAKRRAQYHERRCDILLKQKQDRAPCPLCNLTFRRVYIPIHVSRRHSVQ